MAGTTKLKARAAILEELRTVKALAGVPIGYSHIESPPPESIGLLPEVTEDTAAINTTRATPSCYEETYTVGLEVFVGSKNTLEKNEERLDQLADAIYDHLRNDPGLGKRVPGLVHAVATQSTLISGHVKDEGPMSRLDISVEIYARITA